MYFYSTKQVEWKINNKQNIVCYVYAMFNFLSNRWKDYHYLVRESKKVHIIYFISMTTTLWLEVRADTVLHVLQNNRLLQFSKSCQNNNSPSLYLYYLISWAVVR